MEAVMRLWKSKSRRPRAITEKRLLRCEELENRSLLAIISFTANLRYEDANGLPGALIADDAVMVGEPFYVEVMVRDYDPLFAGLASIALDIAWNPNVLKEVDAPFNPASPNSELITPAFPLFRQGTLDNDAGTID